MNSQELNDKLADISDEAEKYGYEAFGGKAIPYIGWFWRHVSFDYEGGHSFGVLPDGTRGFMENNKWDYEYVDATSGEWAEIKRLLEDVASNPCEATLRTVDHAIQRIGRKK